MLNYMVQLILYFYSFHYGLILIKFAYNYIDMDYHTRRVSGQNFKINYLHLSNIQC